MNIKREKKINAILLIIKEILPKPIEWMHSILKSTTSFKILLLIFGGLIFVIYQSRKRKITKIFQKTEANLKIMEHLMPILNGYSPTLWLPTAETQILRGNKLIKNDIIKYENMLLKTDDNETLPLELYPRNFLTMDSRTPIVAFALGACGSTKEPYCKILTKYVVEKNWRIAVINRRGFSEHHTTLKLLAIDDYNDIHFALVKIKEIFSEASIYLIGISAGANNTAKYLGVYKDKAPVKAYVSISNPFNIGRISFAMKYNFWGNLFSRLIVNDFKKVLDRNMKNPLFQDIVRIQYQCSDYPFSYEFEKLKTTWKMDKYFTTKATG